MLFVPVTMHLIPGLALCAAILGAHAHARKDGGSTICAEDAVRFEVDDAPHSNNFYSDCNSASQVVVTSPLPDSNLTLVAPRLLVRPNVIIDYSERLTDISVQQIGRMASGR